MCGCCVTCLTSATVQQVSIKFPAANLKLKLYIRINFKMNLSLHEAHTVLYGVFKKRFPVPKIGDVKYTFNLYQ
jgi:hypothetical protein